MSIQASETIVRDRDHVVQVYAHEGDLVATVADYLADSMGAGDAVLVIATPEHRAAFEDALLASGTDLDDAVASGTYVALDAATTLDAFVSDGQVDPTEFASVIGNLVRQAGRRGRRVRAYGEMVDVLWGRGQVNAALEVEDLWNVLVADQELSLFCACHASHADGPGAELFPEVHHRHSAAVARFDRAREAPRAARQFATRAATSAGQAALAPDLELVVSELATNAVIHAWSAFTLAISVLEGGGVRVAVRDHGAALPLRRHADTRAESGRGLEVIGQLSSRWGIEVLADGKLVWADLRP